MLAASIGAGRYSGAGTNSSAQSALRNNLAVLDDSALFIPYFTTTFSNYRRGFLLAQFVQGMVAQMHLRLRIPMHSAHPYRFQTAHRSNLKLPTVLTMSPTLFG